MAAFLWGLSMPLAKGMLGVVSPQILAGLFYLGSGIGLALSRRLVRRGGASKEAPLTRTDLPWLLGSIVVGGLAAPVLLFAGLQRTLLSDASLLLNLEVVFTVILAGIIFHENIGRRVGAGVIAILLGCVIISWQPTVAGLRLLGPLVIVAACLCWAIDNNLLQKLAACDPREVATIKGLVAGAVNFSLGLWLGGSLPSPAWTLSALLVGFLTYGLSLICYVLALRKLGTARTGAYFSTNPFVGAVAGLLLWHDPFTITLAIGSIAMVLGIFLLLSEQHGHLHTHEALVHSHRHVHDDHHQHKHSPFDPAGDPHNHPHMHEPITHSHEHYPDIHHRHSHDREKSA